ncbi:unnamed protein product [Plasmodium vivax]|uniref:(malaria parasite P. vivax) hypothetical protein n=1 Tax=Plasmodium vivax TaxID=5855 RepID=A0A8S4H154_PLAVI|nr:unnamed protein product [Plasmodium vivax]
MSKLRAQLLLLFAFLHGGGRLGLSVGTRHREARLASRPSEGGSGARGKVARRRIGALGATWQTNPTGATYRGGTSQRGRRRKNRERENLFIGSSGSPPAAWRREGPGGRGEGSKRKTLPFEGEENERKAFLFREGKNKKRAFLFHEGENERRASLFDEGENERMDAADPELHESLSGCLENELRDNYLDSMIECGGDDYHSDDVHYDPDDLTEETKRKKYHTYGRRYSDKDFQADNVHKYYQHLPLYYGGEKEGPIKRFKRVYRANKIENLERNIREEDLYYPSVPVQWKVYVCLFLDKQYNYETEREQHIYERFNKNVRHRYALEFLSWVKLSTRIYQNTSKVLMVFNLKRKENIFGNLLFFTSVNLHYADMFMKSNPYVKLGLCEELYLYAYEHNSDHFLLGTFPNLFLQKNYLFLKFFNIKKLQDVNALYEKHMRFFVRSNMVFKLGVLKRAAKDTLKDLFLTPRQYLPITEAQTRSVLAKFDREMGAFERCSTVEVRADGKAGATHGAGSGGSGGSAGSARSGDNGGDAADTSSNDAAANASNSANRGRFSHGCVGELTIANCRDEEEAREFLEKDPYTRCCLYESIFFCEVREVAPHVKYAQGYMPKAKSCLDYRYQLDANLNPNYCLEEKPEYMGNRSLAQREFENHERVDLDLLDTFIKLKYANREVQLAAEQAEPAAGGEVANDETTNEGEANEGEANDGAANDETTNEGEANDGAANEGEANDGAANDETTNEGEANGGPTPSSAPLQKGVAKRYKIKIVDYDNDYMEYLCNVQHNKIVQVKKGERGEAPPDETTPCLSRDIYDALVKDMRDPSIYRKKDIILVDNTLEFFDHLFFKDYLSQFVYISLPPGEFIEEPYAIKDEKNYEFTIFNNSLASQEDFLKRQNYQPRFLKGIWLKKDQSKILFYDKQNNALMFGTGIDKTFSWNRKVDRRVMKRALINMEIALEKIRQGSCVLNDDVTVNQETERTIKEYTDEYTSFERRFTSPHNQLVSSEGYPDLKPPPGLEYLNPHIWEKTPEEHKQLLLDTERVQKIHSKFLKKLELYKASIDDDPFAQEVPAESDILANSDKVQVQYL